MNRPYRSLLVLAAASLAALSAPPAAADVLTTTEGREIQGSLLGFAGGEFRFQVGDTVTRHPVAEVKEVTVIGAAADTSASNSMLQDIIRTLAVIQQRLQDLQLRVDQLALAQSAQMQQVQQRVFELNPLSRVTVENQKGEFTRGGSFRVTGYLRNNSGVPVYDPMVRVDLLLADGTLVTSQTFSAAVSSIGPSSRAPFRVEIPSPPRFDSYQILPTLDYAGDPGMGAGTYPALRQEPRR